MVDWQLGWRALRGVEGRTMTAAQLEAFYASKFFELNPQIEAEDTPEKAERLTQVCNEAGLHAVDSLLEIGCGKGGLLKLMSARLGAKSATGSDYSSGAAKAAHDYTGFPVVVADGAHLPFADNQFDLAYFADVAEHVLDPVAFVRESARVSRQVAFIIPLEGGIIASPMRALRPLRRVRGKPTSFEVYGHIWAWLRGGAQAIVDAAGLRVVHARFYHPASMRLEGNTRFGRMMERLREGTRRVSPRTAEALFGQVTFVALATKGASHVG
jgi:SAM-dependent methyltransferase